MNTDDHGWRLGVVATTTLALVLLAWAVTVDFARASGGFFSDGATYYTLAHSLASDFDFEYRREDLVRVWQEFPSGPEGIFLKRGRDLQGIRATSSLPFVEFTSVPDPDGSRLYFGKSFIFPLFAAPFVALFGTNGFLVLHALLLTACFGCAYAFLLARSRPVSALVFAFAFLFASVAPVYTVWLTPDFFNLAIVLLAYFFWAYKEVAAGGAAGKARWRSFLAGPGSDVAAASLLGIATFSKPTHLFLFGPLLVMFLLRRQWRRGAVVSAVFVGVTAGLFAWNLAISGEWNYQGGEERSTFYGLDQDGAGPRIGGFVYQSERHTFDVTGTPRETNRVPVEVLISGDAVFNVFRHNLGYFFLGRHTGFILYFFPGFVAIVMFLWRARARPAWQWLTLAAGLGSAVFLLLYMPYTYSGGGGPVGNRYFLGVYPLFLFVTPALATPTSGMIATAVGALFTAQLLISPFTASVRPYEHTKRGLYRLFPVELSLLNDLPVNVSGPSRAKVPLGGTPPVAGYFLDDNLWREADGWFWVRGRSRVDMLLRSPVVKTSNGDGETDFPLRMPRLDLEFETGAEPNRVTVRTPGDEQTIEIPRHDRRMLSVAMGNGLPYKPFPELPTNYVYSLSIASETGFIPMFWIGGGDSRFLGVRVRLTPFYE
jgi:hypothetical protein